MDESTYGRTDRIVNISGLKLIQYVASNKQCYWSARTVFYIHIRVYRGRCTFCLIFCQFLTFVWWTVGIKYTKHTYIQQTTYDFLHPLNLSVWFGYCVSNMFKDSFGHLWFLQIVRSYYLLDISVYVSIEMVSK